MSAGTWARYLASAVCGWLCSAQPCLADAPHAPEHFTFAVAGDLLGPYHPDAALEDAGFVAAMAPMARADAAFANEEGSAFEKSSFSGSLAAENGGGYPLHPLPVMRGLRRTGIDLLSHANNHTTDYGIEGLLATARALEAIGFTTAGSGRSLEEARAARYFESPHGRVALVAAASTYAAMSPAAGPARGLGPRAGISVLHNRSIRLVTPQEMATLGRIALRGGWQGYPLPDRNTRELVLGEEMFRVSDHPGLTYDVLEDDRAGLIGAISAARSNADVVAFSIHAHETRSGGYDDPAPADFLPPLFHALIDAGADIVIRHGPHIPLGVEIYKGKPIFYGLGSLIFDLPRSITSASEGPASSKISVEFPREWFDSAIATCEFDNGALRRIVIHPLSIDTRDGPTHGLPRPAKPEDAQRILARIAAASAAFGTRVEIVEGLGIVHVAR